MTRKSLLSYLCLTAEGAASADVTAEEGDDLPVAGDVMALIVSFSW